jgi:4-hydroxybenzoate polyprenyltransferase
MRELKRKLDGLVRLSRFKEYLFFVTVTTLLGATASYGYFGLRLLAVLFANICAVAFSFMINDVEDAPDDALNPEKIKRNPVSSKDLSRRTAWRASWLVAVAAAFLYMLVGWIPFIMGMICLFLGFFYSWRGVRFKNLPIIDMLSHCMMLAGLQYLAAYFAFNLASFDRWFFPFMFVTCVSLYGELFNEIRDLDGDLKAGLRHTAAVLGPKPTYWIMIGVMVLGIASAVYMLFIGKLIAPWVCYLTIGLAVVLLIIPLIQFRRHRNPLKLQEALQKPLEIAAAFSLLVQFVIPWARAMLRL